MNTFLKILFWVVLVFLVYHTVRDMLQIVGVENWFTVVGHVPHAWCSAVCDYVAIPFELVGIAGAWVVLQRGRVGAIGAFVLAVPFLIFLGTLLP